ncbi:MAG: 1-(5-phosphoribosyl)-5-[(5-phosphoribosylamino)methylideneamino]imidazole-4-carboxamide isomerase [Thermanaeromonas sp.]|uniref:1-(5-phosphoribosyl)-5-[(5- phosphoribosylamino)methylideneamino]imidazole-4- carboxamide isomerase n=1 Tax=Thermanaeromonas sp. TaxID=2003697 RepID=UPI00243EF41A|nr:1-(5-phosphoribosyl)-5-[(5-phosphoribosylamino)methylideneamino]imidazole-4-carboxamide isomerase [Thermanaeromonas sp.]MCG0277996.1 1-(5-phosphoribosyl)-5-[(5-phosphoribosylamino)methylideneamino]imidazole-4-carboxamide isomerase [Thermanaeromonas sp.]
MIVFPAIDLRGGRCVRLYQGRPTAETVYSEDPVEVAKMWVREGASWLHIVDLDGAFEGRRKNLSLIREIIIAAGIPVQVGGGVRSLDDIEALLTAGAARVILGTVAVTDPTLVAEACAKYGEAIVVGVDCRDGWVATKGWTETSNRRGVEMARELARLGVKRLIYTDISRDGTLKGPNLEAIREVALACGLPVIASGGVASLEDIVALRELKPYGIEGVIIGQALYQGKFSLAEAIKAAGGGRQELC